MERESGRLHVTHVTFENVLGLTNLEMRLGKVNVISGPNERGKTSIIDGIRALAGGGHDATLLRRGAESGQIVFVLSNGTRATKKLGRTKSELTVEGEYGKVSRPQAVLNDLIDIPSLNPASFFKLEPKRRVSLMLETLPLRADLDRLRGLVLGDAVELDAKAHAFDNIAAVHQALYERRTGVNALAADRSASAEVLRRSLPPQEHMEVDWGSRVSELETSKREIDAEKALSIHDLKSQFAQQVKEAEDGVTAEFEGKKDAAYAKCKASNEDLARIDKRLEELQREIQQLQGERTATASRLRTENEALQELDKEQDKAKAAARKVKQAEQQAAVSAKEAEYGPRLLEVSQQVTAAKERAAAMERSRETRATVERQEAEAREQRQRSQELTKRLEQLEAYRGELLRQSPFPGLEVRDGDLYMDGIAFDRLNKAQRIRFVIELAKLRAGKLGLIVLDDLEALDEQNFEEFVRQANETELQWIVTRVASRDREGNPLDGLDIQTLEPAAT